MIDDEQRQPEPGSVEARFTFKRELGSGGFGVVYRAFDATMGIDVALKILRHASGSAVYRFKREFRSLADLVHPNLITLHELQLSGDTWFFTMDLVDGVPFLAHVRPVPGAEAAVADDVVTATVGGRAALPEWTPAPTRPGATELGAAAITAPLDVGRLRAALPQLVAGVAALHRAGKLHCDLKPSNVLVDRSGRVVVCDFGLVTDVASPIVTQSGSSDGGGGGDGGGEGAGTPAYMSPEQAAGTPLTAASDWYGVGVMLYEALTGRRPFVGTAAEIIHQKQTAEPAPLEPRADVPADLAALCLRLLRRDPAARPGEAEILASLGAPQVPVTVEPLAASAAELGAGAVLFVGRASYLAALHAALADARAGRTVTHFLHGESGIGKSTLVRRFLAEVSAAGAAFTVQGRCYERETVPYKSLDTIVDALAERLASMTEAELEAILPRDIAALARLFPALRRISLVIDAAIRHPTPPDPQELRRRAVGALRQLLERLGGDRPVIVAIDDIQWGDADSAAFLSELIQHPLPRGALLIGCYRGADVERSPLVRALGQAGEVRSVAVTALDEVDAVELVLAMRGGHDAAARAHATALVRSAGGHPLYVAELARVDAAAAAPDSLEQLLDRRLASLPGRALDLLRACAVAGHPLPVAVAAAACAQTWDAATVATLRRDRLIRATDDARQIEPYHDRIRATVNAGLGDADRGRWHRQLAEAYETTGQLDAPVLVEHWLKGGEPTRAGAYAIQAAADAEAALSFHLAADYHRLTLALCTLTADEARAIRIQLGQALVNAGRLDDAAVVFREAAVGAAPAEALELRRRALEQVLRAGHLEEGLAQSRALLAEVGLPLPRGHGGAIRSLIWQRVMLRLRGLGFEERAAADIDPAVLRRIDVGASVSSGLSFVDRTLGAAVQMRYLRDALAAGEPRRVAAALAWEVGVVAGPGTRAYAKARRLYASTRALAERVGDPRAIAIADAMAGLAAFLAGRFVDARDLITAGMTRMLDECTDVRWEIDLTQTFLLSSLVYLGDVRGVRARLPAYLREADERGDRYGATVLRGWRGNLMWLADDDPDEARRQAQSVATAPSERFHLHHYYELNTQAQIDLYRGDPAAAWARLEARWPDLERSLLLRLQSIEIEALFLRARTALALAATAADARPLIKCATKVARRLDGTAAPWASALAELLRATMAARRRQVGEATARLDAAIAGFDSADMALFAAVARRRRGELVGGDEGAALLATGDAFMRSQEIVNPAAMTALYSPGW